jgi:hypothetical protein
MTVEYCMARGFESKDVEFQQAERERLQAARQSASTEGIAASRRRGVQLSLTRMRNDLERAHAPAHRAMITGAISALEAELALLT